MCEESAYPEAMETAKTESQPTHSFPPDRTDAPPAVGRLASVLPGLVAALVVAGLGLAYGGYFATAWGPATLMLLAASALALIVQPRPNVSLLALAMPALLGSLALWALASSAWGTPSEAVAEAERTLLYVSAALALGLVLRRGTTTGVLIGLWVGITTLGLYALSTRLFPEQLGVFDSIAGYRLSEPLGYWNALGLLASIGMLLALGLVARAERLLVRLGAAASVVPLALTCYFTFSRGAWVALTAGLVVALLVDPRRLQLAVAGVVVAPWGALAVVIASRSGPLTETGGHTMAAAAEDGRALVPVGLGLALFAAGAVAIIAGLEPRVRIPPVAHRIGGGVLVSVVVGLVLAGILVVGGPAAIARSFAADSTAYGADLDDRLFSLSGSGRVDLWRVARDTASEYSMVGSGAGSFQRFWLERRPYEAPVRDAHNLYLEMLAELGPVGLMLILAAFGSPLLLSLRYRHRPFVPIAASALAAYLARAAIDWDWEFPILTLVALGCAAVIVGEGFERSSGHSRWGRAALLTAVLGLVPVVAVTTIGNRAEAASAEAFDKREFDRAVGEARTAERLAPWSVEPLVHLGRAQVGAGNREAARETFRRATMREPEHWRVWLELAAASDGDARAAALRRARALNPLEGHIRDLAEGP